MQGSKTILHYLNFITIFPELVDVVQTYLKFSPTSYQILICSVKQTEYIKTQIIKAFSLILSMILSINNSILIIIFPF